MHELWYKNAVIYAVDVARFQDTTGDGFGDFQGLIQRLPYLRDLGITAIWLLPFYPSPRRDNGYDVQDYLGIDPRLGSLDEFLDFLRLAGSFGIRVLVDFVMSHTSDQHPWFQAARRDALSLFREFYVWSDTPPPTQPGGGNNFPNVEPSVWTYDELASAFYQHTFYRFQPDLNHASDRVRQEMEKVIDFWLALGVNGFRVDAVPYMIRDESTHMGIEDEYRFDRLKWLRSVVQRRRFDAVLFGEVDVPPERLAFYVGDGDALNMLLNFYLNNNIYLALAREDATPIATALEELPAIPASAQWVTFLRNLDEIDLERLTDSEREEVFQAFAPDEHLRIYGRGIRRRLAPLLNGERSRIEMINSLLFSLPGTPLIVYGDEIGMGEDLKRDGREVVRAPMQWSSNPNGGFSEAPPDKLVQPAISEGKFGYKKVNVEAQERAPDSLLNWMRTLIFARRSCPEIGHGNWNIYHTDDSGIFVHRCAWKNGVCFFVHNFSDKKRTVKLPLHGQDGRQLEGIVGQDPGGTIRNSTHTLELGPYGYQWYRVTGPRPE